MADENNYLFDLTGRTRITLTGSDRRSFLHGFCTQDINTLPAGQGREAILTTIKGRCLGYALVFATDTELTIDTDANQSDRLLTHLRKYALLSAVELRDVTHEVDEFLLSGPLAGDILRRAFGESVPSVDWTCDVARLTINNAEHSIALQRADVLNRPCIWITAPKGCGAELQRQILSGGDCLQGTLDDFTALRIAAAFPAYGVDITEDNLAQETGRTRQAISFTKGCYLGQEPIARLNAMGHVNKILTRFTLESAERPAVGLKLLQPADSSKEVGVVTSVAWSRADDQFVGLGILRTAFIQPGTRLPTDQPNVTGVVSGRE